MGERITWQSTIRDRSRYCIGMEGALFRFGPVGWTSQESICSGRGRGQWKYKLGAWD